MLDIELASTVLLIITILLVEALLIIYIIRLGFLFQKCNDRLYFTPINKAKMHEATKIEILLKSDDLLHDFASFKKLYPKGDNALYMKLKKSNFSDAESIYTLL